MIHDLWLKNKCNITTFHICHSENWNIWFVMDLAVHFCARSVLGFTVVVVVVVVV